MTNRRITVPEDQVAVLLPLQLASELQSVIMNRRRKLGVLMSRIRGTEEQTSETVEASMLRQSRWQEAKAERDILNDFLLALVDAEMEGRR